MGFLQENQTYLPPYNPDHSKLVRVQFSPGECIDQWLWNRRPAIERNLSNALQYWKKHSVLEEEFLHDYRK